MAFRVFYSHKGNNDQTPETDLRVPDMNSVKKPPVKGCCFKAAFKNQTSSRAAKRKCFIAHFPAQTKFLAKRTSFIVGGGSPEQIY